ncbi:MAG: tetratricopeptide repeat protein [Chitinispirillaceae bacterium]|nr:tetratricopeptide repeat protein [Chitinispirillaceae bacterium]
MISSKKLPAFIVCLIVALVVISCSTQETAEADLVGLWRQRRVPGQLSITYPFDGAVFPITLGPPNIRWQDGSNGATSWLVHITQSNNESLVSTFVGNTEWTPSAEQWLRILNAALKGPVTIIVLGTKKEMGKLVSGAQVTVHVSRDPVGAPIFFREVPLPFDFANKYPEKIRYRLGHVDPSRENRVLLENLPLCGNCHSFSKDGTIMGMDVDYANDKGSYVVSRLERTTRLTPEKIITWSDYQRNDKTLTFGLLSQVSPDGRYVVSTVKDRSIFVGIEENIEYSQLFFPIKGILVVYDRMQRKFSPLNGASDPDFVQSNPTWSPEGDYLLFARAVAYHSKKAEASKQAVLPREMASEFLEGKRGFKYDIYKVPFNNGAGGTAVPLEGASSNGMSNYFPKVSPDGKWVVFTRSKNFMLLQPDSRLYIVPAEGGEAREMRCNTVNMNSWHSFSPNGRWMVFSSKSRGAYTQLWLTHIDEKGNDSPPVLLSHLVSDKRAANIPEFLNAGPCSPEKLVDHFSQRGNYHYRVAKNLIRYDDLDAALASLDRAAANQPDNPEVFIERGALRYRKGDKKNALSDFDRAAGLAPDDYRAPFNLAVAKEGMGDTTGALADFERAIALNPLDFDIWGRRASLKIEMKDYNGAMIDLNEALERNPRSAALFNLRGDLKRKLDDYKGAHADFVTAIGLKPAFPEALLNRSYTYLSEGDLEEAEKALTEARKHQPDAPLGYLIETLIAIKRDDPIRGCRTIDRAITKGATKGYENDFSMLQRMCQ